MTAASSVASEPTLVNGIVLISVITVDFTATYTRQTHYHINVPTDSIIPAYNYIQIYTHEIDKYTFHYKLTSRSISRRGLCSWRCICGPLRCRYKCIWDIYIHISITETPLFYIYKCYAFIWRDIFLYATVECKWLCTGIYERIIVLENCIFCIYLQL